ncbi:hypothetical protein Leryth_010765 [Lithospermum erythrorhizon]|nr:hypothetical protein Leryth_010765 [Lithospermum erythrorhizon]
METNVNKVVLKEWFDRVDSDKTGNITAPQLKIAFAVGNLDFSLSIVQQMIRMYDFDKNGTMSFDEFIQLNQFLLKAQQVFADFESIRLLSINMYPSTITQERKGSLGACFHVPVDISSYDKLLCCTTTHLGSKNQHLCHQANITYLLGGRGFLVLDDVYEGLVKMGFSLDSPAFYTVCESFDTKKNGRLKLDDFISLCIFVQSAQNLFNSFDTSKQGRVTLDLNQFIYCTANCRI